MDDELDVRRERKEQQLLLGLLLRLAPAVHVCLDQLPRQRHRVQQHLLDGLDRLGVAKRLLPHVRVGQHRVEHVERHCCVRC